MREDAGVPEPGIPSMRFSPRSKILVVVSVVVLTAWNLHANHKTTADLNIADRTVLFLTAPIQKAVVWTLGGTVDLFGGYVDLVHVKRDNAELLRRLDGWEGMEARAREMELQNQRLRGLVGLREQAGIPSIGAEVIGWGTSDRFRVVRIDRGRADGLMPGLGVIDARGVVGQVLYTSAGAADVLLMSDASSNLAARLQESRLRGIVRGNGRWIGSLEFVNRQDAAEVDEGDLVVTSGDNTIFPAGIPVGRVTTVEVADTGQFLSVILDPASELADLQEVIVLLEPGSPFVGPVEFLPMIGWGGDDYGPPLPAVEDPPDDGEAP